MTRYRKRGTEVEALRWTLDIAAPRWFLDLVTLGKIRYDARLSEFGDLTISVLRIDPPSGKGNPLVANVGDWIVRNGRGEVFPMTAEKFAETYEAVDDRSGRERILALLTDAFGDDGDFFVRDVRAAFDGEKIR